MAYSTTTTQRVTVDHPFWGLGLLLVVGAVLLAAFDLGVLARCGGGEGLCFDMADHALSDAALVAFLVIFFLGLALLLYTGATSATMTTTSPPPARPPSGPAPPANVQVVATAGGPTGAPAGPVPPPASTTETTTTTRSARAP